MREFDGVDDIISYGSPAILDDLDPITICCWLKLDDYADVGAGYNNIITKNTSAGTESYFLYNSEGDTSPLIWIGWTSSAAQAAPASGTFPLNAWHHITGIYDTSLTNHVRLYKNAVEVSYSTSPAAGTGIRVSDAGADFYVGDGAYASDVCFDGKIAYVCTHNVRLTTDEMRMQMLWPGSVRRGLVHACCFGAGSPDPDYSGNGNNGTITGATLYTADLPPINGLYRIPQPNLSYSLPSDILHPRWESKTEQPQKPKIEVVPY